jgi:hypothetical protein
MGFQLTQGDIDIQNPYTAGMHALIRYRPTNTGPDDAGHVDIVRMWSSDGRNDWTFNVQAPASAAGARYDAAFSTPELDAGYYDVAITLPDGTAVGTTVIVQ